MMIKKTQIVGIIFVVIVFLLVSVAAKSDSQAGVQSKKSHAEKLWMGSGHADQEAEAFKHWDEDGEIEVECAKCHSTPGFEDFIQDGVVDSAAALGTTVECEVCHTNPENGTLRDHTSVKFPSGITVENLGPEALCMECHQGRESTVSVDKDIADAAVTDDDTPTAALSFANIHYYAAAANQFGTVAKGGYEYEGKSYDARFSHVTGYNACYTCHNPHSLEIRIEQCNTCHLKTLDPSKADPFNGLKDPKDIRYYGSFTDYDGDGDMKEGINYEIADIRSKLYSAIQRYANTVIGSPIVYAPSYPYFVYDINENGLPDESEVDRSNRYTAFSARLLRAAYNYQVSLKDPANYAHGGKYIIQLLYDSLEDLNTKLNNPVSMAGMHRVDEGHFDGSAEAWRHWDEEGEVPGRCSKCHSAEGLAYFLENNKETVDQEVSNGMLCTTCHTSPPAVRKVGPVTFPSGAVEDLGDNSNICMECHQGRESGLSVARVIAGGPGPYRFPNIHYYPAASVLFGSDVHGGYEFQNKIYAGQREWPNHNGKFDTCVECHMGTKSDHKKFDFTGRLHYVEKPNQEDCVYCHGQDVSQPNPGADPAKFKFSGIRPYTTPDYDGDGVITESVENEIKGLEEALYAQIQAYAANVLGAPIVYDADSYPYFFDDLNANGIADPEEEGYSQFNARLLRAAYNYQLSKKEPHGFIHNSRYVAQLLVDSIEHIRGDVTPYTWR